MFYMCIYIYILIYPIFTEFCSFYIVTSDFTVHLFCDGHCDIVFLFCHHTPIK
jgi:hypothetical protein